MTALFKLPSPKVPAEGTESSETVAPPSASDLSITSAGVARAIPPTTGLKPKDGPFEIAATRMRQAVKPSGGRQDARRPTAASGPAAAAQGLDASMPDRSDPTRQKAIVGPSDAMSGFSGDATSQSADRIPPAPSSAGAGGSQFRRLPPASSSARRPSAQPETFGAPSSEAEAAREAAASRQRNSLLHSGEGTATELIPDLAIALGTMALPFGPSVAAQMAPRLAQRLLPKVLLPEFDGTTSGVLFTNEGRIVRLRSGAANAAYRNYPSAKHAEGKAAIWLRENNSSGGVLFHNHPGGTCGYCDLQTPTLLPTGVSMRVVPPANAAAVKDLARTDMIPYVGDSKVPKLPRPQR
jgi:hypothetical protein